VAEKIYFEDVNVGDEMPVFSKDPVTETQLVKYAGASGDFNPIHTVQRIAEEAKLGGVIAHGMLIMGFVGQAVTSWLPDRCLKKFSVRFAGMTHPGDIITVSGKVTDKSTEGDQNIISVAITAKNQKNEKKMVGNVEAVLPTKA
jgi:acyl dehydratase